MARTPRIPRELTSLVAGADPQLAGKYCCGLPYCDPSSKYAFHRVELGDLALFDDNDVDRDEVEDAVPFASIQGESAFLMISTHAPYPIGVWENVEDTVHVVWPSLDDFVARSLDDDEPTPHDSFEQMLDQLTAALDDDRHQDLVSVLEPVVAALPTVDDDRVVPASAGPVPTRDQRARLFTLYGRALRRSGDPDRAVVAFARASAAGKDLVHPSGTERALWAAARVADRAGVEAALAGGASIHARAEHGQCALELAAMTHDLELCRYLISRGADPWAGNHLGSSITGYFGDDGEAALEAAAAAAGIAHPDQDPWRILSLDSVANAACFEPEPDDEPDDQAGAGVVDLDVDAGVRLAPRWPAARRYSMRAPKKANKLVDVVRAGVDTLLVSEKVAAVLHGEPSLELLPVTLLDHGKKPCRARYFLVNPIAIDCLVRDRCFPSWSNVDPGQMSEVAALVIDPGRVGAARIFRPAGMTSPPTLVSRALADELLAFDGVAVEYLKR